MEAIKRRARSKRASCAIFYVDERKVASARKGVPEERALAEMADLFGALSDRTRLRILHALAREELCVCDLAQIAGRSIPAVSHQLALLRRLRLVTYRNEGKLVYYRLDSHAVQDLLGGALAGAAGPGSGRPSRRPRRAAVRGVEGRSREVDDGT